MNNQHARFILQSHRPGADAADAPMADALRAAERDPELREWFEREREFDDEVRRRLRDATAPADLKAQVLAGTLVVLPAPARRHFPPLAWAASLLLLAAVAAVWLWPTKPASTLASFRTDMAAIVSGGIRFDYASTDPRALERWLNERSAAGTIRLADELKSLPGLGCRLLLWNEQPVALICLRAGDGKALHVFLAPGNALENPPGGGPAQFAATGALQTATWRQGDWVCLASLSGSQEDLRRLLPFDPH